MGILFRGAAMRGPARVSNAPTAFQRLQADRFFQVAQLAFSPAHLHRSAISIAANGNPRGVIPAILQASEAVNNDGNNTFFAYVTYDSAHKLKILSTVDT
jgi:hypothetical protein